MENGMSDLKESRASAVSALLEKTLVLQDGGDMSREGVKRIRDQLIGLASRRELWSEADYPPPNEDERQNRFLVGQHESGISLYLNVMRPGKRIPPHNHTTWACIAGVEGEEENTFFDRLDNKSVPGQAEIKTREVVTVGPGTGVAMLGEDIHSVFINGEQTIRHLHFYGRPLETLNQRLTFNQEAGTCKVMELGVQTKTS